MKQHHLGKITGIALILMTLIALFSFGIVFSQLVSDAGITIHDSAENLQLFKLGNIGWISIIILDLIVTWSIYAYTQPMSRKAFLAAFLRLLYTIILSISVYQLILATHPSHDVFALINNFETIWSLGLIVFGLHLIFIGLSIKKHLPKWLEWLLYIAGLSYILIHFLTYIGVDIATLEIILALPMTLGELGFGLYIMIKTPR